HLGDEGAGLLGRHAGDEGAVEVTHGLQPALGVAGGQAPIRGGLRLDSAVAAVALHHGAVPIDHDHFFALGLLPEDGAVLAVDAHGEVVVVADGDLAGPVDAGGAALVPPQTHVVAVKDAARHPHVHLGQAPLDLQARHGGNGVL